MKPKKALTLSIVIPVYNEEFHIKGCLEAIKVQTLPPFEIIIVNNNCTDNTVAIAKTYDGVRIINEPRQGRGWARTAGFNAARGDIIGRIDADSRIAPNWVELVTQKFTDNESLMGVTGIGSTVLLPRIKAIKSTFWSRSYFWLVHSTFHTITMWGANMAVRRRAWEAVQFEVNNNDMQVHEDQDVSLCMAAKGLKIEQHNDLLMHTMGQTYHYFPKVIHYWRLERSTIAHHKNKGTFSSTMYPRIPRSETVWGRVLALAIGLPVFAISLPLWPIDEIMIKLGKQKTWLD